MTALFFALAMAVAAPELPVSTPAAEGLNSEELIRLTKWLRDNPYPIFSILISRHGKLVYELYTAPVTRDDAHYLMSITKTVLSALVGIAVDRRLLPDTDTSITKLLPRALFSDADFARLQPLTLRQVMGMSAFDAPDPPRDASEAARLRYFGKFWSAKNRVAVALQEPLLPPGGFQYNDSTPSLAAGAIYYASKKRPLEFAEEALFKPLGFRNYQWMHKDATGIDNGGYGLRLRPIDMQKFGILYLHGGVWNGQQLISKQWVERSFQPWNKNDPQLAHANYGWFWWTYDYGPHWTAHLANGWRGQRIIVIPEQDLVITTTGNIEDNSEEEFVAQLIQKVLKPAIDRGASTDATAQQRLDALIAEVKKTPPRLGDFIEYRMVPSVTPKLEGR